MATVQKKVKAIEEAKDLDDETRKLLLASYAKTLDYLDSISINNQQSMAYAEARKQAPEEIKALKKQLENLEQQQQQEKDKASGLQVELIPELVQNVSMLELKQQLDLESANLAAVEAKNSDIRQTLVTETESAPEIRKRLIKANLMLEQLLEDKKHPPADGAAEQKKAQQWLLDTHIAALRSEIKRLDQQLLSQSVRVKLLTVKKELSDHSLKKINTRVRFLEQQVDLKRSSEIQKTQEITREEQIQAQGKHPLVLSLAKSNSHLSEDITNKANELGGIELGDDEVNKEVRRLTQEQASTKRKLEIAGLSQILGQVLLEHKKALPDRKVYQKNMKKRQRQLAQYSLDHIHYQEEFSAIKHKEQYLKQLMADIAPDKQVEIQEDLKVLLTTRRELLEKVINIDESYLQAIGNLDFAEKKLLQVAASYSELLDEHLFWLRNARILGYQNFKIIPEQVSFFLSPSRWIGFVNDFVHMAQSSGEIIPGVLLIFFVLIKRKRIKELLFNIGQKTKKISTDSLLHTWKAIFYTLLLATPVPVLLWLAGWQLSAMADITAFSHAVAKAMLMIILPLFSLQVFRYMCLPGGLSEVHFKWPATVIHGLRKEMGRLMLTFLPVLFITVVLISKGESSVSGGLGRLFLLATLTTFAIFFYRLLKLKSGFLHTVAEQNPQGFFARYQRLWLYLSLAIVVTLMGLTIIGYVYTAGQLTASLIYTVWFIFALIIMQQMSVRWLLLTRRKYALKKAYEKRLAAQALRHEKERNEQEHSDSEEKEHDHELDFEEPEIDMVSLSEDSTQLLNLAIFIFGVTGLIGIWSELLPALGIFEKVELWHHKDILEGTEILLPVTLKDLALALLIAVVAAIGAKRFPAIIEILLLQNTAVTSGSRYTITTLTNYAIVGIGVFSIFNILGADWARFQWLFAALSVGIGFGLQEIVANFISGLIILFERPIRIGDYVSVGENEGVVSKIQIRATTILTRDRKELLVPNKEFITEQLLNWSLSDPTSRLIIPVGVAYGSDIPRARELLLEA
ncbi:MAG: mechanosensitive ion channel, partial [Gammaproteobacteria bacterium]|nr:mechanosensitive ion channel [Gammaproteobacteria bacterium]